jgi:hypothetical protein
MKNKGKLVAKEISLDELCLRCIYHPLHISNGKLKREALLPPPNRDRNDVSLLRHTYTSIEDCIKHGERTQMGGAQSFIAIASIIRKDVLDNNEWAQTKDGMGNINGTCADIYYAPMHANQYVSLEIDVYANDSNCDLPAHADLRYDAVLNGTVQTRLRQYASRLVKRMNIVYAKGM